jgi:hypothetical protein
MGSGEREEMKDRSEEYPMKTTHAAMRVEATPVQRLAFPSCPECNSLLFAAAASTFISERNVRHAWVCEDCGHAFTTTVRLSFTEPGRPKPPLS